MKNRTNHPRQTLQKHWPICAALLLAVSAACVLAVSWPWEEPVKYALETSGGEVDFAAPELRVHTAEDGIAVVSPGPTDPMPARGISDPTEIWQGETDPTHGGFTLPVAMDDESIGILTVPALDLSVRVYESDSEMEDMEKGAAHFKSTSAFEGNVGISAHNINLDGTNGYFLNLHQLTKGASITYETALGTREYTVESIKEIGENDWSMLGRRSDNRVTLITCITGKPEKRLCVQAVERHP